MASLEDFDFLETTQVATQVNDLKVPSTLRVSHPTDHSADSQTASEPEGDKQAAVLHARYTIVCQ